MFKKEASKREEIIDVGDIENIVAAKTLTHVVLNNEKNCDKVIEFE